MARHSVSPSGSHPPIREPGGVTAWLSPRRRARVGSGSDIEVARRFGRPIAAVQGRGAGECRPVCPIKPRELAQVLGPGAHGPNFGPGPWVGDVLIKAPDLGAGAQPHPPYLGHNGKKLIAVGWVDAVAD